MNAEQLKGMAVISIAEGTLIGRIADVLFDPNRRCVSGFQLEREGHLLVVPATAVRHVGPDAVTVEDARTALGPPASTLDAELRLGVLSSMKVVDVNGNYLGQVRRVEIDERTGNIVRMEIHRGGLLGIGGTTEHIDAEFLRSLGPEVLTVSSQRDRRSADTSHVPTR